MTRPKGANLWIWDSPVTTEVIRSRAPSLAAWGFGVVELPIENVKDWDPVAVSRVVGDLGMGTTACAVLGKGRELCAASDDVIRVTQRYLLDSIDLCHAVGATVLGGPVYSSVGRTWRVSQSERRALLQEVRDNLAPVIDHALQAGVHIAVEPLNRYETSLITTVQQAIELVAPMPAEAVGVLIDTFHANIEEIDVAGAIREAGDRLVHVQASASNRGVPGEDHIDWRSVALALDDIDYQGAVCIESFTTHNATIATAASIWRPLAVHQDAIARDGLQALLAAGV